MRQERHHMFKQILTLSFLSTAAIYSQAPNSAAAIVAVAAASASRARSNFSHDHKSCISDAVIEISDAKKYIAGINSKEKAKKNLVDLSDDELRLIYVSIIKTAETAKDFNEALLFLHKLKSVCKKFNRILSGNTFTDLIGKSCNPDTYQYRKWITLAGQEPVFESLSPLHLALEANQLILIEFLIKANSDVNKLSGTYGSMHYVQSTGALELLRHAEINQDQPVDAQGRSPLFYIVKRLKETHPLTQKIIQQTKLTPAQATRELQSANLCYCSGGARGQALVVFLTLSICAAITVPFLVKFS